MTDPQSPGALAERLEACVTQLSEKQPVCPFSQRSPEYLTTDPDKPCHYCGTTQEGPDMCRGIGSDVLDKTEDALRAAAALIRELVGRETWQPIETAPKDGQFWCKRPAPNDDEIILVQRGLPEHGKGAVISYRLGKYWLPTHYLPLSAIPAPPVEAK